MPRIEKLKKLGNDHVIVSARTGDSRLNFGISETAALLWYAQQKSNLSNCKSLDFWLNTLYG